MFQESAKAKKQKKLSFSNFYHAPPKSGERVPRRQIILLGFSNFCIYFCQFFIRTYALQYYSIKLGFPIALFILISWIFLFWNLINDPLIGFLSDKRIPDPKKGKRLVGMKRSLPISVIGFLIVLLVSPSMSIEWMFIQFLIGICIFDFANALWNINVVAYRLAIPEDDSERGKLGMWTNYFLVIPGAFALIIPMILIASADNENLAAIQTIMVIICAIFYVISFFSMRKLEEPIDLYAGELLARKSEINGETKEDEDLSGVDAIKDFFSSLKEDMKVTLQSKPYRKYLIFSFFGFAIAYGVMGNITFLLKYVYLGGDLTLLLLIPIIGALSDAIAQPVILAIRKKIGTINTFYLCLPIGAIGFILMFFTRNPMSLIPIYWLIAIGNQAIFLLVPICSRDVTDEDYVRTGLRKQGKFSSVGTFFNTLNNTIFVTITGLILIAYGYDAKTAAATGSVSEFTKIGFLIVAAGIPLLFTAITLITLKFYPLKGEFLEEIKKKARIMDEQAAKV